MGETGNQKAFRTGLQIMKWKLWCCGRALARLQVCVQIHCCYNLFEHWLFLSHSSASLNGLSLQPCNQDKQKILCIAQGINWKLHQALDNIAQREMSFMGFPSPRKQAHGIFFEVTQGAGNSFQRENFISFP